MIKKRMEREKQRTREHMKKGERGMGKDGRGDETRGEWMGKVIGKGWDRRRD